MNPWNNPIFLTRILHSYLVDLNRIWRVTSKEIRRYQDKCLRKIVKYAYTVPLYQDKFKEQNIHPTDIHGIGDIEKLPMITKDDLRTYYPHGLIPDNFNTRYGFKLSTSGSTGKPVFLYIDLFSSIKSLLGFTRELEAYGGNWKKTKNALIIDLKPGSMESTVFTSSVSLFLKKFIDLKNIRYFHIGDKPESIMTELDVFQPEFLSSDPGMLQNLAYLKNQGLGNNIQPTYIVSSGSLLDPYIKKYIEHAFNTRVRDIYGTTETGPIAFECITGGHYHVHSDFVYLELLSKQNQQTSNQSGKIVITKLYGGGTPILRYTGLNDIISFSDDTCDLHLPTQQIKTIEGRQSDMIILPDNSLLSPLTLTGIPAQLMEEYHTNQIQQFQIIQHTKTNLEIRVVIDPHYRNHGITTTQLLTELKKRFIAQTKYSIDVSVTEVDAIQKDDSADTCKLVISEVKHQ
jgi:phenylacetate-CoA ligase